MLHGLSRGVIAKLRGGKFISGFMNGVSGLFDVGTRGFGGFVGRTVIMAVVGGTFSVLGGGKFSNGAMAAAFVHMFNAELTEKLILKMVKRYKKSVQQIGLGERAVLGTKLGKLYDETAKMFDRQLYNGNPHYLRLLQMKDNFLHALNLQIRGVALGYYVPIPVIRKYYGF